MSNHNVAITSNMGSAIPRRLLNVESAAGSLEGAAADLSEAMKALEERLRPILAPARPSEECGDRLKGDSDVAERIHSSVDVVRGVTASIRDLADRL